MEQPILQVLDDPLAVTERLIEIFGVDQTPFLSAIQDSFSARNEVTSNHPVIYGGIRHYAEGVAFLREQLAPHGYIKYTRSNSEWAQNQQRGVLINFMAGNGDVGLPKKTPTNSNPLSKVKIASNRNPKGIMFSEIARLQLIGDLLVDISSNTSQLDMWCWALMYNIDYKNKVIRSEISCPSKLTANGAYFTDYYERIILNEIHFDPENEFDSITPPSSNSESDLVIDFDVRRKNA